MMHGHLAVLRGSAKMESSQKMSLTEIFAFLLALTAKSCDTVVRDPSVPRKLPDSDVRHSLASCARCRALSALLEAAPEKEEEAAEARHLHG